MYKYERIRITIEKNCRHPSTFISFRCYEEYFDCQATNPVCTELETITMEWLAKMLGLPEFYYTGGKGGGVC